MCPGSRRVRWNMAKYGPFRRSRSFKVTDFNTNRKIIYHFVLVINTNLPPTLHRVWYMASESSKSLYFATHLAFNPHPNGMGVGAITRKVGIWFCKHYRLAHLPVNSVGATTRKSTYSCHMPTRLYYYGSIRQLPRGCKNQPYCFTQHYSTHTHKINAKTVHYYQECHRV